MALMTWSSHFETGIEIVDAQHRGLVDMLNTAAKLISENPNLSPGDVAPLLDRLTEYAAIHFSTEDDLMVSSGVDPRHLEHHRGIHGKFVQQLTSLRAEFERNGSINGEGLLRFLVAWLTFHILGEDQSMARQIHAIGLGEAAVDAFGHEADYNRHDPAQAALVDSLVELFNLVTNQNMALSEANSRISLYRDHLEDLVKARSEELEKLNQTLRSTLDSAERAYRAKSRFLRTVSHELLTPLNAILGFSHLLQDKDLPDKARSQAQKIQIAGQRLNGRLHDLLTYATLDAGGDKEKRVPFSITALFARLVSTFMTRAQDKGLLLHWHVDSGLPDHVIGDLPHISMALEQYLRNAIQFTESGEILLSARAVDEGTAIRFAVQDSGPGLAQETKAGLFTAFQQGEDELVRDHDGMGLGLAIVSSLAQLMHGKTGVDSTPGAGSTFWLTVPITMSGETQPLPSRHRHSLEDLKSLLEQDDLDARLAFANLSEAARVELGAHHPEIAAHLAHFDYQKALNTLIMAMTQARLS